MADTVVGPRPAVGSPVLEPQRCRAVMARWRAGGTWAAQGALWGLRETSKVCSLWRVQWVRPAQQACPIQAWPGESRNPPEAPPGRFLRAEAPRALPSSPAQALEALHFTMTNSDLKMDRGRCHPTEMAAFLHL